MKNKLLTVFFLSFVSLFLTPACDESDNFWPYRYVNSTVTLSAHSSLYTINNHAVITGGIQGIIVYNDSDGYKAYDCACPHHPDFNIAVTAEQGSPIVKCEECGSQFLLTDGSVIKGPAIKPLLRYNTQGNDPIVIVN